MRKGINAIVERRIYAESMGRCMNPKCQAELFKESGDIMEKAHIIPYCKTVDNSFENLIILCPNCHTNFDKNNAFSTDEVKEWKKIRADEFKRFFSKEYDNFEDLKSKVVPLLLENRAIFENYYLQNKRQLWDSVEGRVLSNNSIIREVLKQNTKLIQKHSVKEFSNLEIVKRFLLHIDEFENTRLSNEKVRGALFPTEINSLFGIEPLEDRFLPSVESIECLIEALQNKGEFETIVLGEDKPYICIKKNNGSEKIYLNDTPRLRQMYYDNNCFRSTDIRFESLNYALKYIKARGLKFDFLDIKNLKVVMVNDVKIVFVYKYCLSKVELLQLAPEEKCVILNLHNWNGKSCISQEAYELAEEMKVRLLTMDEFYGYINSIRN
ncbi:HNH endonuclease signature motif containing protein [Clostridium aquiflavi]|uniref:HNH endonuclease signature motif containing protein n=1 Tax=Clostridium aquiflavi TaxID=3073603 RepID=A0ABU1EHN6_9CLOT|nr:HNH endonuclease signature motif containing protein [Clostridium sp. 5N-1]MDR5587899.1 HNH endonuclease signature motif containing protein [Clostridium sp. 5N-1]